MGRKVKFARVRDKCHEILMRPENIDGMTTEQLLHVWKGEERVRRALQPKNYGGRLEPRYGPRNANSFSNMLARDKRFTNLRPSRINGVRHTPHQRGLWVASAHLNSNHTPAGIGEEDGAE